MPARHGTRIPAAIGQQIKTLYGQGYSLGLVANDVSLPKTAVADYLRRQGIAIRPKGISPHIKRVQAAKKAAAKRKASEARYDLTPFGAQVNEPELVRVPTLATYGTSAEGQLTPNFPEPDVHIPEPRNGPPTFSEIVTSNLKIAIILALEVGIDVQATLYDITPK